jgi:hypothetical protein
MTRVAAFDHQALAFDRSKFAQWPSEFLKRVLARLRRCRDADAVHAVVTGFA